MKQRTTCAGTQVTWRSFGSGGASALALHCGLGQSGMWRDVADTLGQDLTVTAPDFPGHGGSGDWPQDRDVHSTATDIAEQFLSDGMHLIGHSFGATVALRLALRRPSRVASLTLIEPVLFAAARGSAAYRDHRNREKALDEAKQTADWCAAAELFHGLWNPKPWAALPLAAQEALARGMPFIVATESSLYDDCHDLLAPGRLEGLTCPVTLIRGAQSQPVIKAIHAGLLPRLGAGREDVVADAGHMLVVTHPQAVARAVAAHLHH